MPTSRRRFLGETIVALAGATAGTITLSGCASSGVPSGPEGLPGPAGRRSAGFDWTLKGLENDSAFAYLAVARPLTFASVRIDATLQPTVGAGAVNSTQALCRAWVSRGAPAFLNGGPGAAGPASVSTDFGSISVYNPAGLTIRGDGSPLQDVFYSAVLRSWVPSSGIDSAAAGVVQGRPSLVLNAGDYLVFGVEQSGMPGDVQLLTSLDYE
jgi:hypothetical protein